MTVLDRNSVFWWLYVILLTGVALYIAYSFIGILVLGLFGYYATRPIRDRFNSVIASKPLAAALTVLTVLIPVLVLTLYAGIRVFQQVQRLLHESVISAVTSRLVGLDTVPSAEGVSLGSLLQNPPSVDQLINLLSSSAVQQGIEVADVVFGTLILIALAVTLSYALLEYDESMADNFATLIGGQDTTVYSYALAVDTDLESIFFGNLLFVLLMSVIATATYAATNLVAPSGIAVPMVFTLGALTGLASLLPIIVGKIVYLPIVAYLGITTAQQGDSQFVFVGIILVVYFLVLDILPQSFIQPYISGQQLNSMILLFAYILGPILFGWYGFFLLPIVFVVMLELVRIVLPELLHGDPIISEPGLAEEVGANSTEMNDGAPDEEPTLNEDTTDTPEG